MQKKVMISLNEDIWGRAKAYGPNFSETVRRGLELLLTKELIASEREKEIFVLKERIGALEADRGAEEIRGELKGWIEAQKDPAAVRGKIYEIAEREKRNWEDIAREVKEGKRELV